MTFCERVQAALKRDYGALWGNKMAVYKGTKKNPMRVEVRAVGCDGESLDRVLKELNADGWNIRQIFPEAPTGYRIFAQREVAAVAAAGERS